MNLRIEFSRVFVRQAKKLSKRHRSLKRDLQALVESLRDDPTQGVIIGQDTRKIRLAITSKGKGKSGGGRVITFYKNFIDSETGEKVILLLVTLYDKSDKDSVSDSDIRDIIVETKIFEEE